VCNPIAGVTDTPRIDNFPVFAVVGYRQEFAEPAGKGGWISIGSAVGGGAAKAEDTVRVRTFL